MKLHTKKASAFLAPIAFSLIAGRIGALFQTPSLETWYPHLVKSRLTPPEFVFPLVWAVLHVSSGASPGVVLSHKSKAGTVFGVLYGVQLLLIVLWNIAFFHFQNPPAGMLVVFLMVFIAILYAKRAFSSFRASSYLFMPYVAWIVFAAYRNLYIVVYNA